MPFFLTLPNTAYGRESGLLPLFLLLVGVCGLFFGQPNTLAHVPPLALLYPFSLFLLAEGASSGRQAFRRGYCLGLVANCACLYWLVYPMHNVANIPYALAIPCVVLLAAYLALFPALTSLAMARARAFFAVQGKGQTSPLSRRLLVPLLGGFAFGGCEVLCGTLFTGFPWISLSSSFAFWPAWVQIASVTGSYGLSSLFAIAACFAATVLSAATRPERVAAALLTLVLVVGIFLFGMQRLARPQTASSLPKLSFIMVQGNIDQNQKWIPSFQKGTLDHYLRLSQNALDQERKNNPDKPPPALILWPETAMPFLFRLHREYARELSHFTASNNVNLIFGSLGSHDLSSLPSVLFNRVYLLSSSGDLDGWFDKRRLVPFGEYTPFTGYLPFLNQLLQGMDFSPGTTADPLLLTLPRDWVFRADALPPPPVRNGSRKRGPEVDAPNSVRLGVLVCYEAIFPLLSQDQVTHGATAFITVSNDAWFGKSSAPLQHLSLTAMRAVEQNRPIMRSTNTGISAVLDSRGRITASSSALFTTDVLVGNIQPTEEPTLYHRICPAPEALLVLLALFSLFGYTLRICLTSHAARHPATGIRNASTIRTQIYRPPSA